MNAGADFSSDAGIDPSRNRASPDQNPLPDWTAFIQLEQTFQLLANSPLTFEVCLYYQVLPLDLEGTRLKLGMVDPSDPEALNYVQTLLGYLNYTLVSGRISLQAHKDTLSAYLKYREQSPSAQSPSAQSTGILAAKPKTTIQLAPIVANPARPPLELTGGKPATELNARETIYVDEQSVAHDETVVIFIPQQSHTPAMAKDRSTNLGLRQEVPHTIDPPTLQKAEDQRTTERSYPQNNPTPTLYQVPTEEDEIPNDRGLAISSSPKRPGALPLRLDIQPSYLHSPIQMLEVLPPKAILEELLARVLSGGIGRLFFERTVSHGRVIWSQNGIIKAELEHLAPAVFDEVIQRLKFMHNLPLEVVTQTTRVEIERFYDQQRLLLRLQLMPGLYGEEANLQILRGVALQFYQQRQLASASRNALNVTQQLQNKLNQIYELAVANNIPEKTQNDMLTTLSQVLNTMDEQLKVLDTLSGEE